MAYWEFSTCFLLHIRYTDCIRTLDKQQRKEEKLEESLNNIACWIEEGM